MDARQAAEELNEGLIHLLRWTPEMIKWSEDPRPAIERALNRFAADVLDDAALEVPTEKSIPVWLQTKAKEIRRDG